jgi:hypothetical protein
VGGRGGSHEDGNEAIVMNVCLCFVRAHCRSSLHTVHTVLYCEKWNRMTPQWSFQNSNFPITCTVLLVRGGSRDPGCALPHKRHTHQVNFSLRVFFPRQVALPQEASLVLQ